MYPDMLVGNYSGGLSYFKGIQAPPAGIPDITENDPGIFVFPNPAKNAFTVQLISKNELSEQTLEMFSLDGKLIYQTKLISFKTKISPGQLQPGIYLIKVTSGSNCNITRLVIN